VIVLHARRLAILVPGLGIVAALALAAPSPGPAASDLRAASQFDSIADTSARSAALFEEASRVLLHPRCVNCHPTGDGPLQGDNGRSHEPPVRRGQGGIGVVGMRCTTCHHDENFDPARVPGAPGWRLAPSRMAWEGLAPGELCAQLKDPQRNGGRTLESLVEHFAEDQLVGWGWHPGAGREAAPGSQDELAGLIRAWVESGAVCPQ
jgi:hypothetical protein